MSSFPSKTETGKYFASRLYDRTMQESQRAHFIDRVIGLHDMLVSSNLLTATNPHCIQKARSNPRQSKERFQEQGKLKV